MCGGLSQSPPTLSLVPPPTQGFKNIAVTVSFLTANLKKELQKLEELDLFVKFNMEAKRVLHVHKKMYMYNHVY